MYERGGERLKRYERGGVFKRLGRAQRGAERIGGCLRRCGDAVAVRMV